MARTPLFQGLSRVLRIARAAAERGSSVDRALEAYELGARERQRRAFLQRTAAAAAGLAVSSCRIQVPPQSARAEVVIVGAGIAGLCCALRLQQAGIRVRVIEAQERIGGRIFSLRDHFASGQVAELGGELIDSGHSHMHALVAELGLKLDDFEADAPQLARTRWHFGGQLRSEREVVEAFTPLAAAIARDRPALTELDQLSLEAWFDRHGVSGWLRDLLAVAYTTEMGLTPGRQSCLNLLTFIGTEPDPFRVFGESDERYHVRGGNDLVIRELGRRLAASIEPGTVLESVRPSTSGFTLAVRRGSASTTLSATHLVLALPLTTLRNVELAIELPERTRRAIHELTYGTNAKLMIGFSQRHWRTAQRSDGGTFSDLPYQSTWETSRCQPGDTGILTNFVGGPQGIELGQGSPAERAARAVEQLERVFHGISEHRAGMREARFHWPTHPWTLGSYLCPGPGDWTAFGGVFDEPFERLSFAGEHCSNDAQGFMEGGCETGERAAARLLAELGAERAPVARTRRRFVLG